MAEVAVTRNLLAAILDRIAGLAILPPWSRDVTHEQIQESKTGPSGSSFALSRGVIWKKTPAGTVPASNRG